MPKKIVFFGHPLYLLIQYALIYCDLPIDFHSDYSSLNCLSGLPAGQQPADGGWRNKLERFSNRSCGAEFGGFCVYNVYVDPFIYFHFLFFLLFSFIPALLCFAVL